MKQISLIAFVLCSFLLLLPPAAQAALVTADTTLTFVPASGNTNRITLTVEAINLSDSDTATVSGNILSRLTLNYDPFTGSLGSVTGLELRGGTAHISDLNFDLDAGWLGGATAEGRNLAASFDTPSPPGPVTGTSFPTSAHTVIMNAGTLHVEGYGVAGAAVPDTDINLANDPLEASTDATGTLNVALAGVSELVATYNVNLSLPVEIHESQDVGVTVNIDSSASTFVAAGSFTLPLTVVPEPSTLICLVGMAAMGIFFALRRK